MSIQYTETELILIKSMCGEFKHVNLGSRLWNFDGRYLQYSTYYTENIKITERPHFETVLADWVDEVNTGRNGWIFTPHPEWFIAPKQNNIVKYDDAVWRWLSD